MSNQYRRGHQKPSKDTAPQIPAFQADWIRSGINKAAVEYAEVLGQILKEKGFSSSQFRNFYGELKRIQLRGLDRNGVASFHLLSPKLAYAASRASKKKGSGPQIFKDQLLKLINATDVDQDGFEQRFTNFCQLVEAILAYHKAYGGRD